MSTNKKILIKCKREKKEKYLIVHDSECFEVLHKLTDI